MNADNRLPRRGGLVRPAAVRCAIRSVLAAGALAVVLACLSACGPTRSERKPGETIRIGFSLDSLVVERWTRDVEVFTRAAKELGAELVLELADQDPAVQEAQIRSLADRGVDVLVVVPNDADRLSGVISEVRSKGIPVLSYDRLVRQAKVDLYVSFDNEKVGVLMAEALCRAEPAGRFVIINGPSSDNNARMLNAGFHKVLDSRVQRREITLAGEIWPETWDSDPVRAKLEALVSRDRGITAVLAGNDMLADAAIGVLAENRLATQARVVGQDADLAACQRIAEGTQYATVYKPIDRLALKAAAFAVMLARGETVPTESTINDGTWDVPYVRLEPILVTRDNLESTVIKDGFHAAADVYRNVNAPR